MLLKKFYVDEKYSNSLICILIFFMSVFQQNLGYMKIVLMLSIVFCFILKICRGELLINKDIILWYLPFVALFLVFSIIGFFKGTPGYFSYIKFYVLYTLFFLIVNLLSNNRELIKMLMVTLQIVHFSIILIIFLNLFIAIFNIQFLTPIYEIFDFKFGMHSGYVEISTNNIDALFFTIPFVVYNMSFNKSILLFKKHFYIISLICFFIVSGRATLQILIVLSIIVCLLIKYKYLLKRVSKKRIIISLLAVFISLIVFLLFTGIGKMILQEFEGLLSNDNPRNAQYFALVNDFFENPIIGNGLGYVSTVIRSPEMPWAYELTYIYLLSSLGLIGFLIYIYLIYRSTIYLIIKLQSKPLIACVFGTMIMYIANSTNPYLVRFDNVWIIFLPLIVYNCLIFDKKNHKFHCKNVQS